MSENPVDFSIASDISVPDWLTPGFIEKHLQNHYKNDAIKVRSCDVRSATAKGENFASQIYRVKVCFDGDVNGQLTSRTLILKTSLTAGFAYECLLAHNVYIKEIEFYGKIVPQINRLLCQLRDSDDLVAETIGVCDVNKAMLFEDLTMKGFRMASIQQGFSRAEAKIVLRKLAKFHASCSVLQANQPGIFANYKHGAISRASNVFHNFYYFHLDSLIESIADWPNSSRYVPKLQKLRPNIVERGCKMFDADPDHFNTLNHGDFWLNNIMVKQKETIRSLEAECQSLSSGIDDVIFIDFQDSCWSSPAIDLHYFLNTSLGESDRPQAFNELIDVYHGELTRVLKNLKYSKSIPTQREFHEQFNARNFYGFLASCTIQPFMINDSTEDADLEAMLTDDERGKKYRRNMYRQPKIQANLMKLLPLYDEMRLFD